MNFPDSNKDVLKDGAASVQVNGPVAKAKSAVARLAESLVDKKLARDLEHANNSISWASGFKSFTDFIAAIQNSRTSQANKMLSESSPFFLAIDPDAPATDAQLTVLKNFSAPLSQRLLARDPALVKDAIANIFWAKTMEELARRDLFKVESATFQLVQDNRQIYVQAKGAGEALKAIVLNDQLRTPEVRSKFRLRSSRIPEAIEAHLSALIDLPEAKHYTAINNIEVTERAVSAVKKLITMPPPVSLKSEAGDNMIIQAILQKSIACLIAIQEPHKALEIIKYAESLFSINSIDWVMPWKVIAASDIGDSVLAHQTLDSPKYCKDVLVKLAQAYYSLSDTLSDKASAIDFDINLWYAMENESVVLNSILLTQRLNINHIKKNYKANHLCNKKDVIEALLRNSRFNAACSKFMKSAKGRKLLEKIQADALTWPS